MKKFVEIWPFLSFFFERKSFVSFRHQKKGSVCVFKTKTIRSLSLRSEYLEREEARPSSSW